MIIKSYKVELKPTIKQLILFNKAVGISRYIYNWGLDKRIKFYEENKKGLTFFQQNKELTTLKQENLWMYDVSKSIHQNALMNLQTAFTNFFRELKKGKVGFPKFKSKHKSRKSFQINSDRFYVSKDRIKINKFGSIKLKEKGYIPTKNVEYCTATISEESNRWFIYVPVEQKDFKQKKLSKEIVGVDLGIKTLATCSDGVIFENPKAYKKYLKKLKREQRRLSRKQKSSKNREKQRKRLRKLHWRIANIRKDHLHKMTTALVRTKPRTVVIEDLNVNGMVKNHKLAGALADSSFGEIRRQLEYKTNWYGGQLQVVPRFFPSSKLCSDCGVIKEDLTLNDRQYVCECGLNIDRDLNAAINIKNYFIRSARSELTLGERLDAQGLLNEPRIK